MKYHSAFLILFTVFFGMLSPRNTVHAARFSDTFFRLDRTQEHAPISGLLCATPSSSTTGTEDKIAITLPSDFTIHTTTAAWTTSTTDIPSDATPWPGIGTTAQQVTGKTVTFASSNLTSTTKYCFTFKGNNSFTGSTGTKTGTISTLEADNTLIDHHPYGLTVTASDRVTLTATVPADPTDFSASLTKFNGNGIVRENETLRYSITYTSLLSYGTNITVEASWSLGTVTGSGVPTVDLLTYDTGSASKAHGGVEPVIDPVNRKIIWTIPTYPGNTTNSVTFNLRTKKTFTTNSRVSFNVSGRVLGPGTATAYSTIASQYLYSSFITPPPEPTSSITPTEVHTPVSTPTPTPSPANRIDGVTVQTISATDAQIVITTTRDSTLTVQYGADPKNLNNSLTALTPSNSHRLTFPDLTPETPYYFRIIARDDTGRRITSELYTFTTAKESTVPVISLQSLVATSEKVLLLSPALAESQTRALVLPTNSPFELQFGFAEKVKNIKSIHLSLRHRNVLGISTYAYADEPAGENTVMLEVKPGVFAGRLKTTVIPGYYDIYATIHDHNGNIAEQIVVPLKVTQPFRILQKGSDQPIERAKVTLFLYNPLTRLYDYISPQQLPIRNPLYSEPDGRVPVILPQGTYRAEIEGIRNENQTVDFTIGTHPGEDYPTVYLTQAPLSFGNAVQYFITTCADLVMSSKDFLNTLSNSGRIFELNALIILGCFVLLSLFGLSNRLRIPLRQMPSYLSHLLTLHPLSGVQQIILRGKVIDHDTGEGIANADIYLLDKANGNILLHTKSNKTGAFRVPVLPVFTYVIEIAKPLYHAGQFQIHESHADSDRSFVLIHHGNAASLQERLLTFVGSLLSMTFEVVLILSFILAIFLGISFGFLKVLPFLTLALVNIVFWRLHDTHSYR